MATEGDKAQDSALSMRSTAAMVASIMLAVPSPSIAPWLRISRWNGASLTSVAERRGRRHLVAATCTWPRLPKVPSPFNPTAVEGALKSPNTCRASPKISMPWNPWVRGVKEAGLFQVAMGWMLGTKTSALSHA